MSSPSGGPAIAQGKVVKVVRLWFARVGSDPYYASYERSLSNIKSEVERLQVLRAARHRAWAHLRARFLRTFAAAYAAILAYAAYVNRQPHGTYTPQQQALRVIPAFLAPLLAWLAHRLLSWLQQRLDKRNASRVQQLEGKLRKQVAELKDSTRYQRTLALLQKYDPDYAPPPQPKPQLAPAAGTPGQTRAPQGRPASRAAGVAVNVAGSALQGAGAAIGPVLAQLYSRAAGSLIADDPVMLGLLREAQQQSDMLRQRLGEAEAHVLALQHEKIQLKEQLGLPTDEDRALLEAWLAPPGGASGPAPAVAVAALPAAAGSSGAALEAEAAPAEAGQQGAAGPLAASSEPAEAGLVEAEECGAAAAAAAGAGGSGPRAAGTVCGEQDRYPAAARGGNDSEEPEENDGEGDSDGLQQMDKDLQDLQRQLRRLGKAAAAGEAGGGGTGMSSDCSSVASLQELAAAAAAAGGTSSRAGARHRQRSRGRS